MPADTDEAKLVSGNMTFLMGACLRASDAAYVLDEPLLEEGEEKGVRW